MLFLLMRLRARSYRTLRPRGGIGFGRPKHNAIRSACGPDFKRWVVTRLKNSNLNHRGTGGTARRSRKPGVRPSRSQQCANVQPHPNNWSQRNFTRCCDRGRSHSVESETRLASNLDDCGAEPRSAIPVAISHVTFAPENCSNNVKGEIGTESLGACTIALTRRSIILCSRKYSCSCSIARGEIL